MQINPPDNPMSAYLTQSPQETQQRKVVHVDAVVNELGKEFGSLIYKTLQYYQSDDLEAVCCAKEAIAQRTLDTPEAIEMAAEKLILFGI